MYFLVIKQALTLQARSSLTGPGGAAATETQFNTVLLLQQHKILPPPAGSLIQCMTSRQSFKSLQAKIQPLRVRLLTDELRMQKQGGRPWEKQELLRSGCRGQLVLS